MSIVGLQQRFVELGRLRIGHSVEYEKDGQTKTLPEKLDNWRLTSASRSLLEAAAVIYGGDVTDWVGAPNEGYFELYSGSPEIDVCIPPVTGTSELISQSYEHWLKGGCQRRCDGVVEAISGRPCLCDPENRTCELKTRISVILPRVPGIGVWRLDTSGWNAALELPGTFQLLAAAGRGQFLEAVLRIEQRTKKVAGEKYPRRFAVPVLDVANATVGELVAAAAQPALPTFASERPALPAPVAAPENGGAEFELATPEPVHGAPPSLPGEDKYVAELTELLEANLQLLGANGAPLISKHAAEHPTAEHITWLQHQLARAQEKLDQQNSGGESESPTPEPPEESLFESMQPEPIKRARRAKAVTE